MSATITVLKKCHHCGGDNPDQSFCGSCGSPLLLSDYIAQQVKDRLSTSVQNRDVLEMDSSIKVFKQAWDWIKLIFAIAVSLLVLTGAGVLWKASDFWSGVDGAKQSVIDTSKSGRDEIAKATSAFQADLHKQLDAGKVVIDAASKEASRQSQSMKATSVQTRADIAKQTETLRSDIENSRQQLQAAIAIQPEFEGLRKQLATANAEIQAQQRMLSSSQDFVKSIFGSHLTQYFTFKLKNDASRTIDANGRYAVEPPPLNATDKVTAVWMLVDNVPIEGTLQLQQRVAVQPPGSFFSVHNLVLFRWGDAASGLESQPLSVSYFPDKSDKEIIRALKEREGRIYADDQPLPHIGRDLDFKGNKWMVPLPDGSAAFLIPTPANPSPSR